MIVATDWIIGCFLLLAGFNGWRTGLLRQIITVVAVFLAYFLAKSFNWIVAPLVGKYVKVPALSQDNILRSLMPDGGTLVDGISFLLLFALIFFAVKFVGRALNALARVRGLSGVNRISGLVLGVVLGFFFAALVVNVLYLIPSSSLHGTLHESKLAMLFIDKYSFFLPKSLEKNPSSP